MANRPAENPGDPGQAPRGRFLGVDGLDFRECKFCLSHAGQEAYRLHSSKLWVCSECGAHYIDYLDPIEQPAADSLVLTDRDRDYFRKTQHHNLDRNSAHIDLVQSYASLAGARVLDIGCGGGLFLARAKALGAEVCGLDVSPVAVLFSTQESHVDAHNIPIEDADWQAQYRESFDIVTLWDVIEHVNDPRETFIAAANMVRPGGHMFVGTPYRDSFYHQTGVMTYKLTRGKFPTFLNQMYSDVRYGHKQILSAADITRLFRLTPVELLQITLLHELSLPHKHYLKKLTRSQTVANVVAPLVTLGLSVARIRNKMIAVGRKP